MLLTAVAIVRSLYSAGLALEFACMIRFINYTCSASALQGNHTIERHTDAHEAENCELCKHSLASCSSRLNKVHHIAGRKLATRNKVYKFISFHAYTFYLSHRGKIVSDVSPIRAACEL